MLLPWLRKRLGGAPAICARKPIARRRLVVEELEDRCLLAAPVITTIAGMSTSGTLTPLNLPIGKSLIVPITATASNPLTYTVTSDNPDVIVDLHTGNPFLELDTTDGTMVFEMLQDVAPNTVATIDGLVQAGFYNGIIFHRVVQGFVIQGGDPTGTGTGGPGFQFDDEFNIDAIFSGNGQLAMANSGPDTNGSQFFVTVGPQRFLDFTYTIFGQLLSGFNVLTTINNVPVDANDKPLSPVTITSAELITDTTDAVITLEADSSFSSPADITVKVDDGHGGVTQTTFTVNPFNDAAQSPAITDPPFLGPVSDMVTPENTPLTFTLTAIELDGGTPSFATSNPSPNATVSVTGNQVTVTPTTGFTGPIPLEVGVFRGYDSSNNPVFDTQNIIIGVGAQPLSGSALSFSAVALVPNENIAVATFTDGNPADTPASFTSVNINWGDDHLSTGTLTLSGGVFTVSGTNTYTNPGSYPVSIDIENNLGATLHVKGTATVTSFTGPTSLDVEDSSTVQPLTDGILILRYMFGFTGSALTSGVLGAGALRTDPSAITAYLKFAGASMLDVDDNGSVSPLTDGILILRYLFGFTGAALTSGALGAGATRTDPTAIETFLNGFNPDVGHLFADSVGSGPPAGDLLTSAELQVITQAAIARWEATNISAAARAALESAHVQLADLGGSALGETFGHNVLIDPDAAGHGWFIDPTPMNDSEFPTPAGGAQLQALASTPEANEMDLLTVVMHELGLVMGLTDISPAVQPHSLMTDVLSVGVRRLP